MKKVLFLCIGNSCRSQMAEGFARTYGADVMEVYSAGLSPAPIVQPLTRKVMADKNINIDDQYPKDLAELEALSFDLVVNMSGSKLPTHLQAEVRDWSVQDPIAKGEEVYTTVRDQIEGLVMQLVMDLRRTTPKAAATSRVPKAASSKAPLIPAQQEPQAATRVGFGRIRPARD